MSQSIGASGELRWSCSMRCKHCGTVVESDDTGFPPDDLRQRLLEAHGRWSVALGDGGDRRAAVGAIRKLLGLNLQEAASLLKETGPIIWTGTEAEADWMARHLTSTGVKVAVRGPDPTTL